MCISENIKIYEVVTDPIFLGTTSNLLQICVQYNIEKTELQKMFVTNEMMQYRHSLRLITKVMKNRTAKHI